MRKFIVCCLFAIFAVAVMAEKQKVTIYIPGMECQNCQGKVDKVLAFEKGVRSLDYDLSKRMVTIVFEDKKTNLETLQNALIKHINYKSYVVDDEGHILMPTGEHMHEAEHNNEHHHHH